MSIALRQLNCLADAIELSRSCISSLTNAPLVSDCLSIRLPDIRNGGHVFTSSLIAENAPTSGSVSVAILKWGTKYGQDYVDALGAALKRHLSNQVLYDIICFTDGIDSTATESSSDGNIEYR